MVAAADGRLAGPLQHLLRACGPHGRARRLQRLDHAGVAEAVHAGLGILAQAARQGVRRGRGLPPAQHVGARAADGKQVAVAADVAAIALPGRAGGAGGGVQPLAVEQGQHRGVELVLGQVVLGLQGNAQPALARVPGHGRAPRQVAQAQPRIGQLPLAGEGAPVLGPQADDGRVHVVQAQLAAPGFGLRGNAAVGHHQAAIAVQQQLVRVHAAGAPFGDLLQRLRVAHADQALAVGQVGFGGVELPAVGTGDHVAVEGAVGLDPVPVCTAIRVQLQQPVAGAAAGKQQAAIGQLGHAVGPCGDGMGLDHLQAVRGGGRGLQHADKQVGPDGPGRSPAGRLGGLRPGARGPGCQQRHALQPLPARARGGLSHRRHPRSRW